LRGGARGGAHVGVLEVLEKNHIPIDIVVGTSMGSFMGGLYAAGYSPQEIKKVLLETQWQNYVNTDLNRQDIPIRKKHLDYDYPGRLGIGINADNELVLPTGVLKRELMLLKFMQLTRNTQNIDNFDNLAIPFRAVATNIKNGEEVVLHSGSLAKAIYASSAIPGGFQPIRIDGVDLVDGGVSDNIPIDVAKKMGADIIIVVDVSENFDTNLDVNSYIVVMGQLVNILMRKNANESLQTLSKDDIVITPDLEGYSGLDADKYAPIIEKGYEAALKAQPQLQKLSIALDEYKKYRAKYRKKPHFQAPIIDEIQIINPTYLSDESIKKRLHQKVGEPLDDEQLRADLLHLYHRMVFDSVDYKIEQRDGKNILIIMTTPSWNNHGDIRFAIGVEDDFEGHSYYSLKFGYTMYGLNAYGGEWKNDFEIGRREMAKTELYQPLDAMQRYYLRPHLEYESVTDIFSLASVSNQELYSDRYGGGLAFGAHIGMSLEIETSLNYYKDRVRVDSLDIDNAYKAYPLDAHIQYDNLDNVNFPKVGLKSYYNFISL